MHGTIRREQINGAILFDNAQDMLTAMFGPSQHDAHAIRWHIWLKDMARTHGVKEWDRAQILAAVRAEREAA